jgi:diamine N-acetyltransferase
MSGQLVRLDIPRDEDLKYRQYLLADAETMSHNAEGTTLLTAKQCQRWYEYWNSEGNFYAYVVSVTDNIPVGEVEIHFPAEYGYPKEQGVGWCSVVIEAKHRGKGYGDAALALLVDYAFDTLHLTRLLHEEYGSDVSIFERAGFARNEEGVMELANNQKSAG